MGQLIAFGFAQLRRHSLLMVLSAGVLPAASIGYLLVQAAQNPGMSPADLWHSFNGGQKFMMFLIMAFSTWVPFALTQISLASVIQASRNRQALRPVALALTIFRHALVIMPLFYVLGMLGLFLPVAIILMLWCFVPVIRIVDGVGVARALGASLRVFGKRAAPILGLWAAAIGVGFVAWTIASFVVPLAYKPYVNPLFLVLLGTVVLTVLNGALIKLYLDYRFPQPVTPSVTIP